jgi:hypothetical protein
MLAKIEATDELKFKPEKCGGFLKSLDVTNLVDRPTGKIEVAIRTKDACPSITLATGMQCVVELTTKKWDVESCVLLDEDLEQDDDDGDSQDPES